MNIKSVKASEPFTFITRKRDETGTGEDHKPSSVPRFGYPGRGDDHSSGTAVACRL